MNLEFFASKSVVEISLYLGNFQTGGIFIFISAINQDSMVFSGSLTIENSLAPWSKCPRSAETKAKTVKSGSFCSYYSNNKRKSFALLLAQYL